MGEGHGADYKGALPLLEAVLPARLNAARLRARRPRVLVGDKGYSFGPARAWSRAHRVRVCVPWHEDQHRMLSRSRSRTRSRFDRELYKTCNVVERAVGHLKQWRRVVSRHEKLALNYLATAQVAVIARHLRRQDLSGRAWAHAPLFGTVPTSAPQFAADPTSPD